MPLELIEAILHTQFGTNLIDFGNVMDNYFALKRKKVLSRVQDKLLLTECW